MHFPLYLGLFLNSNLFDIEDLGATKLHTIEIFSQTTSNKNWVFLAFIGAESIGGGGQTLPPPSQTRNSEPHSRAQVKSRDHGMSEVSVCSESHCGD